MEIEEGNLPVIISNQVECLKCHDKPFSAHRHDFKSCACGSISVDGGTSYLRRVGDIQAYKEMSITITKEQLANAVAGVIWGQETGRNALGIALAVIRGLRDGGMVFPEVK